jgi:predicted phosphate transport protein (TIGR00153 family)
MLVTTQADNWPERHQRVTHWFDLSAAAVAVDEPELQNLIAGFREPPRLTYVGRRPSVRSDSRSLVPMLAWFQSLLPKGGQFFEQFERHAATLTAGADALTRLLTGDGEAAVQRAEIVRQEHVADDITRDVLQDVRRIFVTPFDRSAIIDLIGVMDDAIDQMNTFATATELYEISSFSPQMQAMGAVIVECARVTTQCVPLLRSIGSNGGRISELTARIIELEGDADRIHVDGMKMLFKSVGPNEAMRFTIERELYNSLERVVDRFEDVADEIQGLVIDHA